MATRDVAKEVAGLRRLTPSKLRERYAEVFGEPTRTGNAEWLVRRIAWRLQALAEGDLSERARQRAAELANDADLRTTPPRKPPAGRPATRTVAQPLPADHRLPPAGTVIRRPYKGGLLEVTVLADGFEFAGRRYGSLSAVAKAATGSHCNGFAFFGLTGKGGGR
jgi:Protein of unknown function (DUF2924)